MSNRRGRRPEGARGVDVQQSLPAIAAFAHDPGRVEPREHRNDDEDVEQAAADDDRHA